MIRFSGSVSESESVSNSTAVSLNNRYESRLGDTRMNKLTVYIPETHVEQVKAALFAAGAGRYANYDCCAWQVLGQGQFRPLEGSKPYLGKTRCVERVPEYRVEMLVPDDGVAGVLAALKASHPYEEPAFDFVEIRIE